MLITTVILLLIATGAWITSYTYAVGAAATRRAVDDQSVPEPQRIVSIPARPMAEEDDVARAITAHGRISTHAPRDDLRRRLRLGVR